MNVFYLVHGANIHTGDATAVDLDHTNRITVISMDTATIAPREQPSHILVRRHAAIVNQGHILRQGGAIAHNVVQVHFQLIAEAPHAINAARGAIQVKEPVYVLHAALGVTQGVMEAPAVPHAVLELQSHPVARQHAV